MPNQDTAETIALTVRERVMRRAREDNDFRRLLIDNPKSALARELGIDVSDDVSVTVLQESASNIFIVLPAPAETAKSPLTTGIERLADPAKMDYMPF